MNFCHNPSLHDQANTSIGFGDSDYPVIPVYVVVFDAIWFRQQKIYIACMTHHVKQSTYSVYRIDVQPFQFKYCSQLLMRWFKNWPISVVPCSVPYVDWLNLLNTSCLLAGQLQYSSQTVPTYISQIKLLSSRGPKGPTKRTFWCPFL